MFDSFDEHEPQWARPPSSSCAPGPELACMLLDEGVDGLDLAVVDADIPTSLAVRFRSVEHSGSWERMAGWVQAQQWLEIHAAVVRVHAAHDAAVGVASVGPLDDIDTAMRSLTSDVALAWRVTDRTASRRIAQAVSLVEGLPAAIEALLAGRTSVAHVLALADVLLDHDDPELRRRLCEELLPGDGDDPSDFRRRLRTPGDLKRAARRAAMRRAPNASRKRAAAARRERGVFLEAAGDDGMATVIAYLPADEALAMYRTVEAHARRTRPAAPPGPDDDAHGADPSGDPAGDPAAGDPVAGDPVGGDAVGARPTERRSAPARRADALGDLIAAGALLAAGVIPDDDPAGDARVDDEVVDDEVVDAGRSEPTQPAGTKRSGARDRRRHAASSRRRSRPSNTAVQIRVVIGADTLLGLDDMPAELIGYGPITADHARALAVRHDATWRRMVTEPSSGAVLDIGHTRYRPPAAMADHVRANHPTCAFPGCRMPAEACDLDHVIPFDPDDPRGVTAATNLLPDCRGHHILKTLGGWTQERLRDGTVAWTSPTGHRYRTRRTPLVATVDRSSAGGPGRDTPDGDPPVDHTEAGRSDPATGSCDRSWSGEAEGRGVAVGVAGDEETPF